MKILLNLSYLFILLSTSFLYGQSPGIIYSPPGGIGSTPLNPNGDGWSSVSSTGYNTDDVLESEKKYVLLPVPYKELNSDLTSGNCGYSDIASSNNTDSGVYMYSDGVNLMFRFRQANTVNAPKGYSILIDTDLQFGSTGLNAAMYDPNYIPKTTGINGNPGFEIEIILETNFQVAVYDVDGIDIPSTPAITYNYATHHQRSVALTNNCNTPDYFIDFYINLNDLYATFGINATTPLRYAAATVLEPRPAIGGFISDINGGSNFEEIISSQPGTPIGVTATAEAPYSCTNPPTINGPIPTGIGQTITGNWEPFSPLKPNNATIEVFVNGASIGTTLTTGGAGWDLTNAVGTLIDGDIITAKALAIGESSCNPIQALVAFDCNVGNTPAVPIIDCIGNKGIKGFADPNATIEIYRFMNPTDPNATSSELLVATITADASGNWGWNGITSVNNLSANICTAGSGNVLDGTYRITQILELPAAQCPSLFSDPFCKDTNGGGYHLNGDTPIPTIITNPITTREKFIEGTAVSGDIVRLFINGNLAATTVAAAGIYSFPNYLQLPSSEIVDLVLAGDIVTVSAQGLQLCETESTSVVVSCLVDKPKIDAEINIIGTLNEIAAGINITGTSNEIGSTINIYDIANPTVSLSSVVVAGNNTWDSGITAITGITYFARVTTTCGASKSLNVVALTQTPNRCGTFTNAPYTNQTTTVTGTLSTAVVGTMVQLYIDGTTIGEVLTNTNTWSFTVSNGEIYEGGILTIGIQEPGLLKYRCPVSETINCTLPTLFNVSPASITINSGDNATFTISSATSGILYAIEEAITPNIDFGTSIFSTGTDFDISTKLFNSCGTFNYQIKAVTFNGNICETVLVPITITVNNTIDTSTTVSGSAITSNDTISTYQWVDCDNANAEILGETNQSFTPTSVGNYAVELTKDGCTDISSCIPISVLSINQNSFEQNFTLYPNPTKGNFEIKFNGYQEHINVKVISFIGQLLNEKTIYNSNKMELNIVGSAGIYIIEISDNKGNKSSLKIIKH